MLEFRNLLTLIPGSKHGFSATMLADNYYLKDNFDRIPMFSDDKHILGFVSNISVAMRTIDGTIYFEDTISTFKTLRIQQVYHYGLYPNCACTVFAKNERIQSGYW
jgi:hypothetical protein